MLQQQTRQIGKEILKINTMCVTHYDIDALFSNPCCLLKKQHMVKKVISNTNLQQSSRNAKIKLKKRQHTVNVTS